MDEHVPDGRFARLGRRRAASCAAVVAVPLMVGLSSDAPLTERILTTAVLMWLTRVAAFALLALAIYYRWRVRRERASGWVCACATVCAAFNAPFVLVAVSDPDDVAAIARTGHPGVVLMACVVVMVALARVGARGPWRLRPIQTGLVVGLTAVALQSAWTRWGPDPLLSLGSWAYVLPVGVACGLLVVGCVVGLPTFPAWFRRSAAGVALCGLVLMVLNQSGLDASAGWAGSSLAVDTACSALLLFMAVRLLVIAQAEQALLVQQVTARARAAEASLLADQDVLHELRSTLAGIASASRLLSHHPDALDPQHADRLREGLGREIGRVERLLHTQDRGSACPIDLAETIGPVIECARASGLVVTGEPEHLWVHGQPDDIAEAVHILLENVKRHAPGSPVWITSATGPGEIELRVRDAGPGVAPEVRGRLFVRGIHSDTSPGEGIGLHAAHRMLTEHGGGLDFAEPVDGGAEFVVRLPVSEPGPIRDVAFSRSPQP